MKRPRWAETCQTKGVCFRRHARPEKDSKSTRGRVHPLAKGPGSSNEESRRTQQNTQGWSLRSNAGFTLAAAHGQIAQFISDLFISLKVNHLSVDGDWPYVRIGQLMGTGHVSGQVS